MGAEPLGRLTPVRNSLLRLGGMFAAIAVVVAGERTVEDIARLGPGRAHLYGGLLLLAGAILFGLAARRPAPAAALLDPPAVPPPSLVRFDGWAWAWIGLAALSATVSLVRFLTAQEDWLVHATWLAGILALFIGQWPARRRERTPLPGGLYAALLIVIFLAALASRVYHLGILPYNVDGDYADFGLQAREIALGEEKRLFAYGWAAIPMLGYMPAALTMRAAGTGLVGLYLAGVIEGFLAIVGIYLLGRELFGRRAGILAAALATVSYTLLHFSRTCAYIDPVFFTPWALYLLLRALRFGSGLAAVSSGAFLALDMEMYYSGRVVVFLAALAVLATLARSRTWLVSRWRELLLAGLATAIVLGPMLYLFVSNREALVARSRDVLIFSPDMLQHLKNSYQVRTIPAVLANQAERSALLFWTYTDTGTQFGARRAFLDSFSALALALGIGYALFTWRRLGSLLALSWLATIVVFGSFLTINAPFFPRLVMLVIPVALLGSAALDRFASAVENLLSPTSPSAASLVPGAALAIALTLTGLANWKWYVQSESTWSTNCARLGRYLASRPELRVNSAAVPEWWAKNRELRFLAPEQTLRDVQPAEIEEGHFDGSVPIVFPPSRASLVRTLASRFPDATVEAHPGNSPGETAFFVFRRR